MKPPPDLVIFDCDGVLVDSEIIAAEVESALLTDAGYPIGVEEMGELAIQFGSLDELNGLIEKLRG